MDDPHEGPMNGQLRFPIVALGASAGGLGALQAFFRALPVDRRDGMACFIVAQHLSPRHRSQIAMLLGQLVPLTALIVPFYLAFDQFRLVDTPIALAIAETLGLLPAWPRPEAADASVIESARAKDVICSIAPAL